MIATSRLSVALVGACMVLMLSCGTDDPKASPSQAPPSAEVPAESAQPRHAKPGRKARRDAVGICSKFDKARIDQIVRQPTTLKVQDIAGVGTTIECAFLTGDGSMGEEGIIYLLKFERGWDEIVIGMAPRHQKPFAGLEREAVISGNQISVRMNDNGWYFTVSAVGGVKPSQDELLAMGQWGVIVHEDASEVR